MTDAVPGFEVTTFAHEGVRTRLPGRTGPAVIVIHEIPPGRHPGMTAFGQRLVDAGYHVYLPSLFGRLTEELVDSPGHPTRAALDRVMAFLAERLGGVASRPARC